MLCADILRASCPEGDVFRCERARNTGKRRTTCVGAKRAVVATRRFTAENVRHRCYYSKPGSMATIGRWYQARIGLSGDARAHVVVPRDGRGADHSQRRRRRNGRTARCCTRCTARCSLAATTAAKRRRPAARAAPMVVGRPGREGSGAATWHRRSGAAGGGDAGSDGGDAAPRDPGTRRFCTARADGRNHCLSQSVGARQCRAPTPTIIASRVISGRCTSFAAGAGRATGCPQPSQAPRLRGNRERQSACLTGVDFLESLCMPSLASGIRTPKLPLLPLWEKGAGG